MKNKKRFVTTAIIAIVAVAGAFAQTIKGTVTDEATGEPIIGATVTVVGEKRGATSDINGNFTLKAKELPTTLLINYVGYRRMEIDVYDDEEPVNISLTENRAYLNEVVVVGYGTQKRLNLASAISTINSDAVKDVPVTSVDQVLQGRSSGLQLTNPSGNVGTAPVIRIRGVASITSGNSPLYVVDGVPVHSGNISSAGDANALSDINPDDIESINVLKDASAAALYGSRAANGVILITTKRGAKGTAKVSYNGWVGVSNAVKQVDVLNAEQFVNVKNYAVKNRWGTDEWNISKSAKTTDGSKAFNLARDANGNIIDTDWSKYVFRSALSHSHAASVEGGNDKILFRASVNYLDQEGIVRGDNFDRVGVTFNIDAKATKWLKIGANQSISLSNLSTGDRSRGGNITAYAGFTRLAWSDAPNVPVYDADGSVHHEGGHLGYGPNTVSAPLDNPASLLDSNSGVTTENFRWLGSYYAEINPFKNLTLRTQYGRDFSRIEDRDFYGVTTVNGYSVNGKAQSISVRAQQSTWTNTLTYNLNLNDIHTFDFLLGHEQTKKERKTWGAERTGLVDDSYTIYEAAYKNITALPSVITESSLLSFFGRVNYDYDSRYILSLNFRRDGFSALSKNNRWGNFGGGSAAWRISQEKFFKPLQKYVDELKLKASWGVVGNTSVDDYASHSFYSSGYYGNNGSYVLGQIGDSENLKWETSKKFDIGFSVTLFNRIDIDFDYYYNSASDLILSVPVSPSKGIPGNSITTNSGSMRNSGIELNISADVINKRRFKWNTSFNFSTSSNKVTSLSDGVDELITAGTGETTNITKVGYSIGQLYLYETRGIDQETGRRIFVGKDGEDVLCMYEKTNKFYTRDGQAYSESNLNRIIAGNTLPTWFGGWTNNFQFGQFDATVFFQFSGGNKIYNGSRATLSDVRFWNNSVDYMENYWTLEHTNATYALPVYGDNYSNGSALPISDWVEKGDFIRLKNISIGYSFNTDGWLKSAGISKLRLYAQAQNLFVITGYSGLDPEVISQTGNSTLAGGTDHNTAPQARTFTFGAQISF